MQLGLDSADRLAAALHEAQEPMALADAARLLLSSSRVPVDLQRKIVDEVVQADARLAWRSGTEIALAAWSPVRLALGDAVFCVVDLETTGIRPGADRIVEIGAVRVEGYELADRFERLVDPGVPLPAEITRLTGIRPQDLAGRVGGRRRRCAPSSRSPATPCWWRTTRASTSASSMPSCAGCAAGGSPAPCSTPSPLARKLVPGRTPLLAGRAGRPVLHDATPCHRALPDALATAEILLALIGKAQERGAETVDDLVALSVPPARRAHTKRALAEAAPRTPGTYVMRDAADRPLYVGAAGDLRQRTMSYFRGAGTPRPVERVLPAVERLEFREAGSPFEARLDEIGLIGALRPGANRQGARPDRLAFLRLERERLPRLVTADEIGVDGALTPGRSAGAGRPTTSPARCAWRTACAPAEQPTRSRRAAWRVASGAAWRPAAARPSAPRTPPRRRRWPQRCRAAASRSARLRAAPRRARRRPALRGGRAAARRRGGAARRRHRAAAGPRRARSLHGVVLCAHRDPRLVAAFAVAYGLVVEQRPLPRAGDAVARGLGAGDRRRRARWRPARATRACTPSPADRRDEALHVAAAFARPASRARRGGR